jgi:hypothetical protein
MIYIQVGLGKTRSERIAIYRLAVDVGGLRPKAADLVFIISICNDDSNSISIATCTPRMRWRKCNRSIVFTI